MLKNHPKTMMTQIDYALYELCEAEAARQRQLKGGVLRPQWRNIIEKLIIEKYGSPDNG